MLEVLKLIVYTIAIAIGIILFVSHDCHDLTLIFPKIELNSSSERLFH